MNVDNKVAKLQHVMSGLPQLDIPVEHIFAPDVYMRKITIPSDSWLVGKTHKTEHLNLLLSGECFMYVNGVEHHLKAPEQFISKSGDKKVFYTVTEVEFATIHPTKETDLNKIELEVIDEEKETQLQYTQESICHG